MTPEEPTATAEPSSAEFDAQVTGIAALGEPIRRALYRYVAAQVGAVNRDQAAAGAGVARHVAKFHLEKLVDDGLLRVEYSRPPGRGGPGAGRPAKLYRRSSREFAVNLPPRKYELAGRLMAQAITAAARDQAPIRDALRDAAREVGRSLGLRARERAGTRPSRAAVLVATTSVLRECGFEPRADHGGVTLANCPFHALAQDFTDLMCGMNLELMSGLFDSLVGADLEARLEPTPGQCCVHLRRTDHPRSTTRGKGKESR